MPRASAEERTAIEVRAEKQLDTMYKAVPLLQDVGYHKFVAALSKQAYAYNWPKFIMTTTPKTVADLTATELLALDNQGQQGCKDLCNIKNAYLVITAKCTGHTVSNLMSATSCPDGAARVAMDIVREFFFPGTTAGKSNAYITFFSSTMESTRVNVVEWINLVNQNAQDLRDSGGQADESAELAVLQKGLLPEFKDLSLHLKNVPNLTLKMAIASIMDFARDNHWLDLSRGGGKDQGSKVYFGQADKTKERERRPPMTSAEKAKLPCHNWAKFRCSRTNCPFQHAGSGSTLDDSLKKAANSQQGATPRNFQPASSNFMQQDSYNQPAARAPHVPPASSNLMHQGTAAATDSPPTGSNHYIQSGNGPVRVDLPPSAFKPANASCNLCQGLHATASCPAVRGDSTMEGAMAFLGDEARPAHEAGGTDIGHGLVHVFIAFLVYALCAPPRALGVMLKILVGDNPSAALRTGLLMTVIAYLALDVYGVSASTPPHATVLASSYNHASVFNAATSDMGNASTNADCTWCIDTGTNRFITNDINDFLKGSIQRIPTDVSTGNGTVTSECYGTVLVRSSATQQLLSLERVLYLPKCAKKLMPIRPFLAKGCSLHFNPDFTVDLLLPDHSRLLHGTEEGGLFFYHAKTVNWSKAAQKGNTFDVASPLPPTSDPQYTFFGLPVGRALSSMNIDFPQRLYEAHCALGHLHFDKVRKVFGVKPGPNPSCDVCAIAKQRKEAHRLHFKERSRHVNHRMHLDIGFTRGSRYPFQLAIDDYTREGYLELLDDKGQVFDKWKELKLFLEHKNPHYKFAFVRTDSEFVYTSNAWMEDARAEGYEHEYSTRYRHEHMGVGEAGMDTVGTIFRCLMIQGGAPSSDIPNALCHANVIRNNSPTKANNGWTPKEKAAGMKLGVNKRLIKGPLFCLIYAFIYKEERDKHDPNGVACVYLGYDDRNDQYKVKEWISGKIYYTADGVFHPTIFPYRASPDYKSQWLNEMDSVSPRVPVSGDNPAPHAYPTGPRRSDRQHGYQYSGGQSLRVLPDSDVPPGAQPDRRDESAHAHFIHHFGPDPDNWSEALQSRYANEWIKASLEEKASFLFHKVYVLVRRSELVPGQKLFKPRPVFKIKVDPPLPGEHEATLDKFKFRQTIAAFAKMMVHGVDYEEKRASTVRWEATLVLIAIAVILDLEIALLDVRTFFLYGKLTPGYAVYMEQPPEWVDDQWPADEWVCKLERSMYGLPQAPHRAQVELRETLLSDPHFTQSTADDCVFVGGNPELSDYVATGTHVDDCLAVGTAAGLSKAKSVLKTKFEITETHNPAVICGVQIVRDRESKWLKLHQAAYIETILHEFGQTDCKPVDTPLDPGTARAMMLLPVSTDDTVDKKVLKRYQKLVGMLIWLYRTRPDILFVVNLLARFLKNATAQHLKFASDRPLRYLKGTLYTGICFLAGSGATAWTLSGQADSDLAGDLATSRSTSGYFARLGLSGCVSYSSSLERKISTSTQQAETYALTALVKDVVWLRHLLADLGLVQVGPTQASTDNQGVFLQSVKQVNHATAKHFRIAQAYIRYCGESGAVVVLKVATERNGSDMLTKCLPAKLFLRHRLFLMGPQAPPRM